MTFPTLFGNIPVRNRPLDSVRLLHTRKSVKAARILDVSFVGEKSRLGWASWSARDRLAIASLPKRSHVLLGSAVRRLRQATASEVEGLGRRLSQYSCMRLLWPSLKVLFRLAASIIAILSDTVSIPPAIRSTYK